MRLSPISRIVLFPLMLSTALPVEAQSSGLPMPLASADPATPIEIIDDRTWTGDAVRPGGSQGSKLDLMAFTYDEAKGPAFLVVDYAATRPAQEHAEASIEIGIECPESPQPCAIPIQKAFMLIDSDYMGEIDALLAGRPQKLQVGRESHGYTFPHGTLVSSWLSLGERKNLEPQAIRARWVYGQFDRTPLPGQATRESKFLIIAGVIAALLVLAIMRLRRS
jgi:hypothetical protein